MQEDITEYVKGCAECQHHKVNTQPTKAPLQPIYLKPEAMPFETVALDFIVKLPVSQGYNSILTVTDQGCTKAAIFIPCHKDITAEEMTTLYIKHVFTTLDYQPKSSVTEIPDLCPNSCKQHAKSQGLNTPLPQLIIPEQMDNQKGPISG
jgi:hypothetical protein